VGVGTPLLYRGMPKLICKVAPPQSSSTIVLSRKNHSLRKTLPFIPPVRVPLRARWGWAGIAGESPRNMCGRCHCSCSFNIFAVFLDSLRNLPLDGSDRLARVLRNPVIMLALLPSLVPRVVPMPTCKGTRHESG
jgi:hypothetical protein